MVAMLPPVSLTGSTWLAQQSRFFCLPMTGQFPKHRVQRTIVDRGIILPDNSHHYFIRTVSRDRRHCSARGNVMHLMLFLSTPHLSMSCSSQPCHVWQTCSLSRSAVISQRQLSDKLVSSYGIPGFSSCKPEIQCRVTSAGHWFLSWAR